MSESSSGRERIVLGSRNAKKCEEIRNLLAPWGVNLVGLHEVPGVAEVVEDQDTFIGNARKKAVQVARELGAWVLAEDSGLCVPKLGGAPGIYSARYAGEPCDDDRNNEKLIAEMSGLKGEARAAYYVCTLALSDPEGEVRLEAEGRCQGLITTEPRGSGGFGYDPYFLLREYHRTFGELGAAPKAALSHRARAFAKAAPSLAGIVAEH